MPRRNGPLVLDQALNWIRNHASQQIALAGEPTTAYEGCDPNVWVASTAYAVGSAVRPTVRNGFAYEVTTAGSTAATEPTWPTTAGATVVNGGVTFTCRVNRALCTAAMAPGDYTLANGLGPGNIPRRVILAARSAIPVFRTGSADHVGLMRPGTPSTPPELFQVTVCAAQPLTDGNQVSFPAWNIEFSAPT